MLCHIPSASSKGSPNQRITVLHKVLMYKKRRPCALRIVFMVGHTNKTFFAFNCQALLHLLTNGHQSNCSRFYTETPHQRSVEGLPITRLLLILCYLHRTKQHMFKPACVRLSFYIVSRGRRFKEDVTSVRFNCISICFSCKDKCLTTAPNSKRNY